MQDKRATAIRDDQWRRSSGDRGKLSHNAHNTCSASASSTPPGPPSLPCNHIQTKRTQSSKTGMVDREDPAACDLMEPSRRALLVVRAHCPASTDRIQGMILRLSAIERDHFWESDARNTHSHSVSSLLNFGTG